VTTFGYVVTVCLPTPGAREGVGPIEGVRVLVWDGEDKPPAGLEETEFYLGNYMGGALAARALAQLPRLKVIQLLSAGVEPWLPIVPAGVTLCNGRGVHGGSTAELAVAGLLSLLRDLPRYHDEQAAHRWSPEPGDDLDGKQVLILGGGDIGRRIAAAVSVFDAVCTFVARTARDGVHGIDELDALLPAAEVVVVSLPHTDETHHLVDAEFFAALPDGAILVNIARGAIVDQDALLRELQSQRLKAFLDVTDPEPLPPEHPLWDAPNLVLTPHVGGGTSGWRRRGYRLVREQIGRYVRGEPLENVVSGSY
jgi:phosphoglycerate dehydrogenase-like enzyme